MTDTRTQSAVGSNIFQNTGDHFSGTVGFNAEKIALMLEASGRAAQDRITELSEQLSLQRSVVTVFLGTLKEKEVPTEQLQATLTEIANRYISMMQRLTALNPEDAVARALIDEAHTVLLHASSTKDYDRAESLLLQASASQGQSIRRVEEFEREAHEAARRLRRDNAATLAEVAELSLTRLDYLQAAGHLRSAAGLLAAEDAAWRRDYLLRAADALKRYGDEKGDNAVLAQAIARYNELLRETPRASLGGDWATKNNLGNALSTLGERESGTGRLEEAVAAYRAALEERTRERVPLNWATTQNNLGTALCTLGARESGTGRLEEAVAAYRAALEEYTRERVPLNWATTQNNLGNALSTLGERESGTGRLEEAVDAYRAALEEYTRERVPLDWATTQNNLGNALSTLGERESGTGRLEEAVAAYRAALEERTRERVPLNWAMTQNNLGNALRTLGERESGTGRLEEAVDAYRAALEERTRERVPLDWAMTQNNLGNALRTLGERESGTGRLEEAVAAIASAWEMYREAGMTHYDDYFAERIAAIEALMASRQSTGDGRAGEDADSPRE